VAIKIIIFLTTKTITNMEKNNKFYYKIDVMGKHGYSFMVSSNDMLDEGEVLDLSVSKGLFEDEIDADYAVVDDLVSDYDIENFKDYTYEIN
jgi:hypothetical protein